jgi:dodecin
MKEHVYKLIELIGTSTTTMEDAINNALERAGSTLNNLRWFQVVETRGDIENNKVSHWQVTIKVGFTVEEEGSGSKGKK